MSRWRGVKRLVLALCVSAATISVCCGHSIVPAIVPAIVLGGPSQAEAVGDQKLANSPADEKKHPGAHKRPGHISPLSVIEGAVRLRYREISHLSPDRFEDLRRREDVVLVDVREADEFDVSHLDGAVRVDPEAKAGDVLKAVGNPKGKTFVFYCSVGARSSILAQRVRQSLMGRGAKGVYNLSGGIFRWHNEERALVHQSAPTSLVHKYDDYWGQLLRRQDLAVPRSAKN